MSEVITIGLDLAKNVFQVHGVDATGKVVIRRQLRRSQVLPFFKKLGPCLIGMEACATAHHWARQLTGLGFEVKLMPPHYVKPYVKRGKNDAADAAAICEAVTRPTMRFVAVKSIEQQGILMVHRTRELLVPRQNSTGGKPRLGRISKQGDPYLRWLLVAGALSVVRHAKGKDPAKMPWLAGIIARKPTKVAAVALANKNARRVWAVLMRGDDYCPATS